MTKKKTITVNVEEAKQEPIVILVKVEKGKQEPIKAKVNILKEGKGNV